MFQMRWRGIEYQRYRKAVVALMIVGAIISLVIGLYDSVYAMVVTLGIVLIGCLMIYFIFSITMAEIWHSISIIRYEHPAVVIFKLLKALKEEQIPFTKRRPLVDPSASYRMSMSEILELDGQTLHLTEYGAGMIIFLGPVKEDNKDEVERLKGLVEKAIE